MYKNPMTSPSRIPIPTAAARPTQPLLAWSAAQYAMKAPISICPSTARFSTPERSE